MKCPICHKDIKPTTYYDEHALMESIGSCRDEHHFYSYEFLHGHTTECVGVVTFHSHHSDSMEAREHTAFMYKVAVYYERLWYEKKKKGQ